MSQPNRKRKASAELSMNPHTARSRDRVTRMQGVELQIEMAKKADQGAITYALNKLKHTDAWKAASVEEQANMKKASHDEVVHKRYVLCL